MEKFFNPKSVAVIGASGKKGKIGYEILYNIMKSGIEVYPINPRRKEILGKKCYTSVEEIDGKIDLAVISIDAEKCVEEVEKCGRKGIKNVIVISGGFKEIGREDLERKLVERARDYGIRIIGPNCIGVFNGKNGFNTFFQRNMDLPKGGKIAILTQSGTFGIALLEKFAREGVGVSKFVSYGNKADVNEVDLLRYLERDNETNVIAIYAEDLRREFFENVGKKTVVILKTGRSKLGQKAASLHTGAMASSYEIFKGVCRQKNIIFADDFTELFGILKILAVNNLPRGKKLVIITNGAGPSVLACDFIEDKRNIELVGNVVDLTGSATAKDFLKAIEEKEADIILLTFVFQDAPLAESLEELYEGLKKIRKFCMAISMGGNFVEKQKKILFELGIPVFEEPHTAVKALDKVIEYAMRK